MPDFRSRITGKLNAASSSALAFRVDTDNQYRIDIDAGGKITWGPGGSTSGDTTLYRAAVDALKTDDSFEAASGLITLTSSGAPSATLADGALAVDSTNHQFYFRSGSSWRQVSGSGGGPQVQTFTISGTLSSGIGLARWYAPRSITISNVIVSVSTAPTGNTLIFDVNKNDTSIFTNQANRPTIQVGAFSDLTSVPNTTTLIAGDYLTVDIDQIGSTVAGANAVVQIEYS